MMQIKTGHKIAILQSIRDSEKPIGSNAIARIIQDCGIELSGRTIRLYLDTMEEEGLVGSAGRGRNGGRNITPAGIAEINNALVVGRVGFTAAKVDTLAWQMNFDLRSCKGSIVMNITTINKLDILRAIDVMGPVFEIGLGMGEYALYAEEGERIGHFEVPKGQAAIGTICSVSLNGIFLKAGIPMVSRFGGVLEMRENRPVRFTDVIYYEGTSLDPLEIFIKGGLTRVGESVRGNTGQIGASFREIPTASLQEVNRIRKALKKAGLDGILMIGVPNQPLLDFPVHDGRTGMIVSGGLNPAAAIEEAGISTSNFALSCLVDFEKLVHYKELASTVRRK